MVAIGLSYGFIEPLESTGLLTTHENILYLLHQLTMRGNKINNLNRQAFNLKCDNAITVLSNFVAIHYAMSTREDTPYWRYITENIDYALPDNGEGTIYIGAGMGFKRELDVDQLNFDHNEAMVNSLKEHIKDLQYLVDQMPSHYEYLKQNIYK